MKRLIVFVPLTLLVLFLLNSFVQKENKAVDVPVGKVNKKEPERVNTVLKSADGGQTWQDISNTPPELEKPLAVIEHHGVIIATGQRGIKRSTNNGESWEWVVSEGGVGIAVEQINGGFAAIAYNATTRSRRIHVSFDDGKTWTAIDNGLPPSPLISSVKQVGKHLIVGHPEGIFHSADMGKTWTKVHAGIVDNWINFLPSMNSPFIQPKKVFKLFVADGVVYAVEDAAGC